MPNEDNGHPFLLVKGLTVEFGGLSALMNVHLEVSQGGIRGIIGPNGAGKTTLFNALTGFVKAAAGEVKYQGEEILGLRPHEIAKKGVIRTFQGGGIFSEMNVLENLMTGYHRLLESSLLEVAFRFRKNRSEARKIREKALRLLEALKLEDLAESLAGDLSFGQQRLVELGRALMSDPKLLLLDEPAAGLSSSERDDLIQLLNGIAGGNGIYILLTDHSMDFVMGICDYITVLNYGQVIGEGIPEDIQKNREVIEAYLGHEEESDASGR
jgi:branched-chain amino acid transport system ATP-binding protein